MRPWSGVGGRRSGTLGVNRDPVPVSHGHSRVCLMLLTEVVGNRTYATLQLLAACQRMAPRITVLTGCGGMRPSMIRPHPRVLRSEQQAIALSNRFAIEATSGLSGEPVSPRHTRTCVHSLSAGQDPNKTTETESVTSLSRSREEITPTGCGTRLAHPLHRHAPHRFGRGRGHEWLPQRHVPYPRVRRLLACVYAAVGSCL